MAILDELNDALKEAMKTKEKAKLDAIRQVKSEIEEKRAEKGEDITELAIRFGLKKEKICQILIDNKVDVTEETKAILLSSITKSKRQLNIRLNSTDDQLLEEITQKINEKMLATSIGDIEFSLPGGLGLSKAHIARILLKDAIKRLSSTLSE